MIGTRCGTDTDQGEEVIAMQKPTANPSGLSMPSSLVGAPARRMSIRTRPIDWAEPARTLLFGTSALAGGTEFSRLSREVLTRQAAKDH